MRVWRICRRPYAATAYTGEGSRLFSGRWNPVGVAMVYSSPSLALAALEVFVHLDPPVTPVDLVSVMADLPVAEEDVERVEVASLPKDWRELDNLKLMEMGAEWVGSGRSLALLVPSVVVMGEWNLLINPLHASAREIRLGEAVPFEFDARMFRGRG